MASSSVEAIMTLKDGVANVLRSWPPKNDACSCETDQGSGGIPTIGFDALGQPKPRQRTRDVDATIGGKGTACIRNIDASQTQGKEHQTAGSDQAPPGRRPSRSQAQKAKQPAISKNAAIQKKAAVGTCIWLAPSGSLPIQPLVGVRGGTLISIDRRNSCAPSGPDASSHKGPPSGSNVRRKRKNWQQCRSASMTETISFSNPLLVSRKLQRKPSGIVSCESAFPRSPGRSSL